MRTEPPQLRRESGCPGCYVRLHQYLTMIAADLVYLNVLEKVVPHSPIAGVVGRPPHEHPSRVTFGHIARHGGRIDAQHVMAVQPCRQTTAHPEENVA